MAIELGTGYVSVVPETKNFGSKLQKEVSAPIASAGMAGANKVQASFAKLQGNVSALLAGTNKVTVGAGLAGAGMLLVGKGIEGAMGKATTAAKEYGSEVVQLQRLTGATARESSTWAAILGRYNVTGAKAALVVKSLTAAIAGHSEGLKSVGIATQNADGSNRTSMEVLADLAEKYKNADDKTQILAVGTKTLGRGFASLLPVLARGKQGIDELAKSAEENGLIFSDADIKAVLEYNHALADNAQVVKGASVQVGLATLPFETWKQKAIGDTYKNLRGLNPELAKTAGALGSVAGPAASLTGKFLILVAALPYVSAGVKAVGVALDGTAAASMATTAAIATLSATMAIATVGIGVAYLTYLAAERSAHSKSAQAARDHAKALGSATGSQATWQSVGQKTVTTLNTQAGAHKNNNASVTVGVALSKKFADATSAASGAVKTLVRDIHGLMVAEDSLSGATRSAKDAQLAYRTALLDKKDAHKEVTRLEKAGKKGTEEYTRAQIAAQEADLRATDAKADMLKAQHDVNTAYITGSTNTKSLTAEGAKYAEKLNTATDKVSKLKAKLDTVPKSKRTEVQADIKKAEADVAKLKRQIAALKSKTIQLRVSFTGGGTIRPVVNGRVTQMLVNAYGSIVKHRPGGYLSTMAERGVDEAAIPLENTPRSRALLAEAASRILGGTSTASASAPASSGGSVDARSYNTFNVASDYDAERAAEILERRRKQSYRSSGQLLVT